MLLRANQWPSCNNWSKIVLDVIWKIWHSQHHLPICSSILSHLKIPWASNRSNVSTKMLLQERLNHHWTMEKVCKPRRTTGYQSFKSFNHGVYLFGWVYNHTRGTGGKQTIQVECERWKSTFNSLKSRDRCKISRWWNSNWYLVHWVRDSWPYW